VRRLKIRREWDVDEATAESLVVRTRVLLRIIIIGNLLFAVADPWLHADVFPQLSAIKLVTIGVQLAGLRLLSGTPGSRRTVAVGLLCFAAGAGAGTVAGVITRDPFTTPLLCIAGALTAAAVIPWGPGIQLVVAAIAVLAAFIVISLVATLPSLGYPLVGLLLIAAISVYIAYEFARQRAAEATAKVALQRRQAELAHVLRVGALGEMAAQLAHELTQPLGAIANYAAGCRRRLQATIGETDPVIEVVDRIASEALRAGEIIRRLRGFVRKAEPRREAVDVNALVDEVVRLVAGEARESNVPIEVSLHPGLPEVHADGVQIEQVVMNLVRNALEAMHDNAADTSGLAIETRLADGAGIEVAVCDSGPGLRGDPAEIFEPFQTTKPDGLGMGLAISRSIIEAHGGRLWVTTNSTRGVTFSFTLPARRATIPEAGAAAPT
jgi:signal transduction histidine kinase